MSPPAGLSLGGVMSSARTGPPDATNAMERSAKDDALKLRERIAVIVKTPGRETHDADRRLGTPREGRRAYPPARGALEESTTSRRRAARAPPGRGSHVRLAPVAGTDSAPRSWGRAPGLGHVGPPRRSCGRSWTAEFRPTHVAVGGERRTGGVPQCGPETRFHEMSGERLRSASPRSRSRTCRSAATLGPARDGARTAWVVWIGVGSADSVLERCGRSWSADTCEASPKRRRRAWERRDGPTRAHAAVPGHADVPDSASRRHGHRAIGDGFLRRGQGSLPEARSAPAGSHRDLSEPVPRAPRGRRSRRASTRRVADDRPGERLRHRVRANRTGDGRSRAQRDRPTGRSATRPRGAGRCPTAAAGDAPPHHRGEAESQGTREAVRLSRACARLRDRPGPPGTSEVPRSTRRASVGLSAPISHERRGLKRREACCLHR